MTRPDPYRQLLHDIKARITSTQSRAALSVQKEMLRLYWSLGELIHHRQQTEGWGTSVIPRLARDLALEFPAAKGFSETNLKRMVQYFHAYPNLPQAAVLPIGAQPVPQLTTGDSTLEICSAISLSLSWGHNILLLQKFSDPSTRLWYMQQCVSEAWSRDVLGQMIKTQAHLRYGTSTNNFPQNLSQSQSKIAENTFKDPYIFDFLTIDTQFREIELEKSILNNIEKFLLELGIGFAFVGRQYHLQVGEDDFYLDLLFYHLKLRCFVVVELKTGSFKAEYAGKMNFYLNIVDDILRHSSDEPSIGLILCQDKRQVIAEYALRGLNRPIGVSEYQLTRALPESVSSALPTIEEIEAELQSIDLQGAEESDGG